MTIVGIVLAWYASGLVGSALSLEFCFRRNGFSITVGDIWFGLVTALTGPMCLVAGVFFFIGWVFSRVSGQVFGQKGDRVVFKGVSMKEVI